MGIVRGHVKDLFFTDTDKWFSMYCQAADNGCIECVYSHGETNPRQYIRKKLPNGKHRYTLVYRAVFEKLVGPIEDETINHLCFNIKCVNPEHLEPDSFSANAIHYAENKIKPLPYICGHAKGNDNDQWSRGKRRCKQCSQKYQKEYQRIYREEGYAQSERIYTRRKLGIVVGAGTQVSLFK